MVFASNVHICKTADRRLAPASAVLLHSAYLPMFLHTASFSCCVLPLCPLLLFPHPVMLPGLKEAVQDQTYNTNGKQHINPYAVKAAFRQPPHNEDTHKCQRKQAAPF